MGLKGAPPGTRRGEEIQLEEFNFRLEFGVEPFATRIEKGLVRVDTDVAQRLARLREKRGETSVAASDIKHGEATHFVGGRAVVILIGARRRQVVEQPLPAGPWLMAPARVEASGVGAVEFGAQAEELLAKC